MSVGVVHTLYGSLKAYQGMYPQREFEGSLDCHVFPAPSLCSPCSLSVGIIELTLSFPRLAIFEMVPNGSLGRCTARKQFKEPLP
jgi:hypothetical protein